MKKINSILLGVTGSVAAKLTPKIYRSFSKDYDCSIVVTKAAKNFFNPDLSLGKKIFDDETEWNVWECKESNSNPVFHIHLRDSFDVLLICPMTMNTLGKISNGLCDNLLTCVFRAWPVNKPIVLVPAANTQMWENPITKIQIDFLMSTYKNISFVDPIEKKLVCGEQGIGAMNDIEVIKSHIDSIME